MKKSLLIMLIGAMISQSGCFTAFSDNEKKADLKNQLVVLLGLEDSTDRPSVSILNARDDREIKSGFVIGTASGLNGIDRVEFSLDGGDFQSADGTEEWKFQLPTGVDIWKRGTEHTISVRSVDSLNTPSPVVSITVRKGHNTDIDGDGYQDMAVGAPSYNDYDGRVYVYYDGSEDMEPGTIIGLPAGSATDLFGKTITLGDINGDGYADLVVGAPGSHEYVTPKTGCVYLFHGGSAGIDGPHDGELSGEAGVSFGGNLAIGDVNGDGCDDIAVGETNMNTYLTRVHLFHGGAGGISGPADLTIGDAGNRVGYAIAMGDVNGDGYADIALADSYRDTNRGIVFIHHGSGSGINTDPDTTITGESEESSFGFRVSIGDITGDEIDDLVVSSYQRNSEQGSVYLYSGRTIGINPDSYTARINGESQGDGFGMGISLGDVDGDGYLDLAVSAAMINDNYTGRVYLYHGRNGNISNTPSRILPGPGTEEAWFGFTLALGDIDGDGLADLTAGTPFIDSFTGRIWIYRGSDSGIPSTHMIAISGEVESSFGYAVSMSNYECYNLIQLGILVD